MLERVIQRAKSFGKKLVIGSVLVGSLYSGCKVDLTGDVTVKEESFGEIVGNVFWDYDGDGVYTGISGADVECSPSTGGVYDDRMSTTTTSGGAYSFHDVPIGTYYMRGLKIVNHPEYSVWSKSTGASVTKGDVTKTDMILERTQ